ncbi:energy transducer TonB [Polymorphum gilvum]|uniref:TonB family protein n=1 Tax=Polymorphum gilvum (strain LMG 25793 / CGMCC 1.9160 / SL003B-26A1) TaxID=991905 RepID=F2IZW0_POLGS|nr:energy transducer TonB [Polymorphum gilvum]ADZ70686.1 TonB family protein [Polymorphum gilvum SL003B-26A1]
MTPRPWHWGIAIGASLAIHMAAAALSLSGRDEVQIAGGSLTPAATLGEAFLSTLTAGAATDTPPQEAVEPEVTDAVEAVDPIETLRPVETPPLQAAPVHAAPVEPVAPAQPAPVQPSDLVLSEAGQMPVAARADAGKVEAVEAARPEQVAVAEPVPTAVRPVEATLVPAQVSAQVSAAEAVPVPTARPERPRQTVAAKAPERPVESRPEKPARPTRKAETAAHERKPSRPAPGAGGQAQQTVQQGGATARGASNAEGNAEISNYPGKVAGKLRRALRYPASAKRKRITGEALVGFVVTRSGAAQQVRIVRSSGSAELDEAALQTVHRAAPFPPIPAGSNRDSWPFTVPLAFR